MPIQPIIAVLQLSARPCLYRIEAKPMVLLQMVVALTEKQNVHAG